MSLSFAWCFASFRLGLRNRIYSVWSDKCFLSDSMCKNSKEKRNSFSGTITDYIRTHHAHATTPPITTSETTTTATSATESALIVFCVFGFQVEMRVNELLNIMLSWLSVQIKGYFHVYESDNSWKILNYKVV